MKFSASAIVVVAASVAASVAAGPAPAPTAAPAVKLEARQGTLASSIDLASLTSGLGDLSSISIPAVGGIDPSIFESFSNIAQFTSENPSIFSQIQSIYSANPGLVSSVVNAQSSELAAAVGSSSAAAIVSQANSILTASGAAPTTSGSRAGDGAIAMSPSGFGMTAVSFLAAGAGALLVVGAL